MIDELKKLLESLNVRIENSAESPALGHPLDLAGSLAYILGVLHGQYQRGVLSGLMGASNNWETVLGAEPEQEED